MHIPIDRTAHTTSHTTAFDGTVVGHWLELAQTANAPAMQARSDEPNLYRRVPYQLSCAPWTLR